MRDIREPKAMWRQWFGWMVFDHFGLFLAAPIGAIGFWLAREVLGIRDIGWLMLIVGLFVIVGVAGINTALHLWLDAADSDRK
jgi:hypothetical protein